MDQPGSGAQWPPGARPRQRGRTAALVVLLVAAVGAVIYGAPRDSDEPASTPAGPVVGITEGQPELLPLTSAAADPDPLVSAEAWLQATQSLSYTDASATAWIDRVRPVVTADLSQEYNRSRGGGQGAHWPGFVDARCVRTVVDVGATVPDEAPTSPTVTYVQVAGSVVTACRLADPPPPEDVAATLTLIRGTDNRWRVAQQLF